MRKVFLVGLTVFALMGCRSAAPQLSPAQLAANKEAEDLRNQQWMELYNCKKILSNSNANKQTALPYANCLVNTKKKYNLFMSEYEKLEDLKRVELAKQLSAGKISIEQYNIKTVEANLETEAHLKQDANANALVSAQSRAVEAQERSAAAQSRAVEAQERSAAAQEAAAAAANRSRYTHCTGGNGSASCYTY